MNTRHLLARTASRRIMASAFVMRRPRTIAVALIVGSALGLSAATAAGQEPAGRVKLGPLSLAPTVAISGIGVDGNVFNEAGERKSDFTTTFAPQVDAWLQLGRSRVSGSSRTNVRYFKQYSNQGGTSTSNQIRLDVESPRFSPYVAGGFENTFDRTSLEIDTRAHHQGSTATAGTVMRLTGKVSFDVAFERRTISFDEGEEFRDFSLRDQLNRSVRRLDVTGRYELTPLTRMTVSVNRDATSFEVSPERDSTGTRIMTGFDFKPLALINGSARVGVLQYKPVGGPAVTLGPIAAIELGYTLRGSTRFGVTVDRDLGYSVDDLKTYYLQTGFAVRVSRQIDEHWDIGANAGRQRLGTHSSVVTTLPVDDLAGVLGPQTLRQFGATVGYRVSRQLRLGVNADKLRRSGVPSEEYGNLRVFGTVLYSLF